MPSSRDSDESAGISILLMEGNQAFFETATTVLKQHKEFTVVGGVHEHEEVLSLIQRLQPEVVLVGLDVPGQLGLKTISRLRQIYPEIAIIAMSMLGGEAHRRAALSSGADEFVPKRSFNTGVLPAILRALQRHKSSGGTFGARRGR